MTQNSDLAAPTDGGYAAGFDATEYLRILAAESGLLLAAADARRPSDEVAFCPGWTVRDLVTHVGWVYRWVSVIIGEARDSRPGKEESHTFQDPEPADDPGTMTRLAAAATGALEVLRRAPADLACWTIWTPPSTPRNFWIRRMVHETLIHRVDAQNAGGAPATRGVDLPLPVCLDGIDEMMLGFAGRYSERLRDERPGTLEVRTTDSGHRWWVRISGEAPEFGRGGAPTQASTVVQGPAGEILLWLWNRRPLDGLAVHGESHLTATWSREAHL
jgi:uncharacterized protein (TIGR03083 family)